MGIFNFLKKEKKEEPKEKMELGVDDLNEIIKINPALERKSMELVENIRKSFLDINEPLKDLDSAVFSKDKIYARVNMAKDGYVKRAKSIIAKVPKTDNSYKSLDNFRKKCKELLAELRSAPPKQGISVTKYFQDYSNMLVKAFSNIEKNIISLEEFLSEESRIKNAGLISSGIEKMLILKQERDEMKKEKETMEEDIKKNRAKIQEAKNELNKLLNSKEYSDYKKAIKDMANLKDDIRKIEENISTKLNSVERPLKKLAHIDRNITIPSDINSLKDSDFRENLKDVLDLAESGDIDLKDSEKRKVNNMINFIDSELPSICNSYNSLKKSLNEKNIDDGIKQKKKDLKIRIEILNNEHKNISNRPGIMEEKIAAKNNEMNELKKMLEKNASEFTGKDVKLV